jgi:predicted aconitase
VYSNSLLGLKTNKESALSALASSVTGKMPLSDLRLEDARIAKIVVESDFDFRTELDYGLLGYSQARQSETAVSHSIASTNHTIYSQRHFVQQWAHHVPVVCSLLEGRQKKKFTLEKKAQALMDELSTADNADIITLGSPQLGLNELKLLAKLTETKKFTRHCIIFCSLTIYNNAVKVGLADKIERSGVDFRCDSWACLTPYVTKDRYDTVITNSVKGAYCLSKSNKVKVALKDIRIIAEEYTQ